MLTLKLEYFHINWRDEMSGNLRFYTQIVSTILFVIIVFMNFLGYWTADRFIQIVFFFSMIFAVFSVGIETDKKLKNRS